MQVADVNGIRRTIILTSENRKVGDSPAVTAAVGVGQGGHGMGIPPASLKG